MPSSYYVTLRVEWWLRDRETVGRERDQVRSDILAQLKARPPMVTSRKKMQNPGEYLGFF